MVWRPIANLAPGYVRRLKLAVFLLCLVPLALLAWDAWHDALGANPIEFITRALGVWALRLLLLTLAISPLKRLTGLTWLMRLRRMLGLYVFFYAILHLTAYLWLDQFFDWQTIAKDILKRPFITFGMSAFALLIPLALTSSNAMMKRVGGKRWQQLHRLVYAIAVIGVVHYWWLVKLDVTRPAIYAALLALLLGVRLMWRLQRAHAAGPQSDGTQ